MTCIRVITHSSKRAGEPAVHNTCPVRKNRLLRNYHITENSGRHDMVNLKFFLLFFRFLTYNPPKRITCQEGLYHEYFDKEPPLPIDPAMFPTWPAKSENPHGRSKKTGISPKPPSGGKNFKDLVGFLESFEILLSIFVEDVFRVFYVTLLKMNNC